MGEPTRLRRKRAIRQLSAGLLIKLATNQSQVLRITQIEHYFDKFGLDLIPEADRQAVLDNLTEDGLIELGGSRSKTRATVERYSLTSIGLATVEAERKRPKSAVFQILVKGEDWLQKRVEEVYGLALDSPLEIVPVPPATEIDLTAVVVQQKKLLSKLDQLIEALNSSNTFRQGDNTNYIWVSADLTDLKKQIEGKKTTVSKLEKAGFGALTYVAKKFADNFVSALATDAWKIIISIAKHFM